MKKILTILLLSAILGIILISCAPVAEGATEAVLPVIQPTASLADKVSITLASEFDTSVQYNTVGQVVKLKYKVNMVKNDLTDSTPPNITFIGVSPVCPAINSVGNQNDRLDATESIDCTLDYAITQADLDRGTVTNTATVMVYTVSSNTINTTVVTVPSKALAVTLSANPTSYYQTGQTVVFTYSLKNSGTSQIGPSQCTVTHSLISASAFNCGNADATIAPGATLTCTANYTITAADLNSASISATATGTCPGVNPDASDSVSITNTTPPAGASGATVQHTVRDGEWLWQIARCYGADPAKTVAANSQLANVAQLKAGMIVNVPNVGSNGTVHAPPEPCVAKYVVQSGDTWSSIAAKYGADPGFTQYVNENSMPIGSEVKVPYYTAGMNFQVTNPVTPTPASVLSVTSIPNPTTYTQSGQVITFSYTIKNNGTTTLGPTQCTVTDVLISPTAFNCGLANSSLAPNATISCSANYTISQADMNAASISNRVTAACAGAVTSQPDSKSITKAAASITLNVVPSSATYNQAGQVITFTYTIANSGTTTLGPTTFTVTDGLISPAAFNCGAENTTLAPNTTVSCSANYTVTQDDMSRSSISNSAIASGGGASTTQPVSKTITKQ